ncbi:phosphoribosylanthranilate isomerase [Pontixanthobacter aestiaquae]|uniref:N-(5'-phosphoribosyl)anthranilate isomerase n=1 Tax=Pontixanthobacter aestiaquae TaxID=1509367 RepID=A0A844ZA09_9SPHN|nr:phosphoribosylanthranilate isomerase [Pontixanthobacter aestiaquae]MDN3645137.1 phosphoribosylanthranilate isomerase [Pontixanthobacter aestiaquae]MXO83863.1 phosphoribosylanthranilate isomerase [Pontixanthobacter aestiaquae]
MTTQIKICGITTSEAMSAALDAGATHIGLVYFEPSPRHIALPDASRLRAMARGRAKAVLLLVNADIETTSRAIEAVKPDVIQFHGNETPEWCALVSDQLKLEVWKALGVKDAPTLAKSARYDGKVDRLLFDAPAKALPGGTGTSFDWSLLTEFDHQMPWGLAGGLTPDNVAEAIRQTGTGLVDTSSGVESAPGVKDEAKIRAFCEAVRAA